MPPRRCSGGGAWAGPAACPTLRAPPDASAPAMRHLVLGLLLCAAAAAQPSDRTAVNVFATVESDDGYLNLRDGPSARTRIDRRLSTGERVLVLGCEPGRRGARWCHVATAEGVNDALDVMYGIGHVYDAELVYDAPRPREPLTVAGSGVPDGFRAEAQYWTGYRRVASTDGYVNLRSGPSTADGVMQRMPSGQSVWVVAHDAQATGPARWVLLYTFDEGELGYAYDAELVTEDHGH